MPQASTQSPHHSSSDDQGDFEKKWQKEVTNKLLDVAAASKAEETAAVRAATEAAQVLLCINSSWCDGQGVCIC